MSGQWVRDPRSKHIGPEHARQAAARSDVSIGGVAARRAMAETRLKTLCLGSLVLMLSLSLPRAASAGLFKTTEQEAFDVYQSGDFEAAAKSFSVAAFFASNVRPPRSRMEMSI